jgi:hypothetical protein
MGVSKANNVQLRFVGLWMVGMRSSTVAVPVVYENLPTACDQAGVPITTSARWVRVNGRERYRVVVNESTYTGASVLEQVSWVAAGYPLEQRYVKMQFPYHRNKGNFRIAGRRLRDRSYQLNLGYEETVESNGATIDVLDYGSGYTYIDYEFTGGDGTGFDAVLEVDYFGSIDVTIYSYGYGYTTPPTLTILDADGSGFEWDMILYPVNIAQLTTYATTTVYGPGTAEWEIDLGAHTDSVPPLSRPQTVFWITDWIYGSEENESWEIQDISPDGTADGYEGYALVPGTLPTGYLRRDETDTDRGGGLVVPGAYSPDWRQLNSWGDQNSLNYLASAPGDRWSPPTTWTFTNCYVYDWPCRIGQAYMPAVYLPFQTYGNAIWSNAFGRATRLADTPGWSAVRVWTSDGLYDYDLYPPFLGQACHIRNHTFSSIYSTVYHTCHGVNWRNMRVWYRSLASTTPGSFSLDLLSAPGFSSVGTSYSALTNTVGSLTASPTTAWQFTDVSISTSASTWSVCYERLTFPVSAYGYEVQVALSPAYDVPLWFSVCGPNNGIVPGGVMTSLLTTPIPRGATYTATPGATSFPFPSSTNEFTTCVMRPPRGRYRLTGGLITTTAIPGATQGPYITSTSKATCDGTEQLYAIFGTARNSAWSFSLSSITPTATAISSSGTSWSDYGKITATATGDMLITTTTTSTGFRLLAKVDGDGLIPHHEAEYELLAPSSGFSASDLGTPPSFAKDGSYYRVASGATGEWAGHVGEIAIARYDSASTLRWTYEREDPAWAQVAQFGGTIRIPVTSGAVVYLRCNAYDQAWPSGIQDIDSVSVRTTWAIE